MNCAQIAHWRMAGERASNTVSFTYISYCHTIRTQIHNWSESSVFAKMWNCLKSSGFDAVQYLVRVRVVTEVPVWFEPDPELIRQFGTFANTK